jgi:hypothetical protein
LALKRLVADRGESNFGRYSVAQSPANSRACADEADFAHYQTEGHLMPDFIRVYGAFPIARNDAVI